MSANKPPADTDRLTPPDAADESIDEQFHSALSFSANDATSSLPAAAAASANVCSEINRSSSENNNTTMDETHYDNWPTADKEPTWTPIVMQSPASYGRAAIYMNRNRQQQLVCSTPLTRATVPKLPAPPMTPPAAQANASNAERRTGRQLSDSQLAERDLRYLDHVLLPRLRPDDSFHMSRVQSENLNSAQRRNYQALCRQVYGPTKEDLAAAEQKYQETYGHLHKPIGRRFGMRL